jgi:hypothetical protein
VTGPPRPFPSCPARAARGADIAITEFSFVAESHDAVPVRPVAKCPALSEIRLLKGNGTGGRLSRSEIQTDPLPTAGYREVPAFNGEPWAHHWFEKVL